MFVFLSKVKTPRLKLMLFVVCIYLGWINMEFHLFYKKTCLLVIVNAVIAISSQKVSDNLSF